MTNDTQRFERLFRRRLATKRKKRHISDDGQLVWRPIEFHDPAQMGLGDVATRAVEFLVAITRFGWQSTGSFSTMQTMIPDLGLVVADGDADRLTPIGAYIRDADMTAVMRKDRFMVRHTIPSGKSEWIDERWMWVVVCDNIGDQTTLKIVFPELL